MLQSHMSFGASFVYATGCRCGKHGILNNEKLKLGVLNSEWEFWHEAVKVRDIFDAVHGAGMTTGAVIWPVTLRHPSIDYLVNWPSTKEPYNEKLLLESGVSPDTIRTIFRPNRHFLTELNRSHPNLENFEFACAADIIRKYKPNLLMVHPANIDAARHHTGVYSDAVTAELYNIDLWLGWILKAVREAGIEDDTDIFVVSDHGQINITRSIALNAVLAERGLIDVDADGNIVNYIAISKSSGASAQIFLKDKSSKADYDKTYAVLKQLLEDGIWGIGRVYTAEEAREEEGLYGEFSFVVDTDGYTSFHNDWRRPFVRPADNSDYKYGRGTHGHQPDLGPQPTLLAFGPDIRPGVRIARRDIIDEAPTYARILGVEMPDAEGHAIEEILR